MTTEQVDPVQAAIHTLLDASGAREVELTIARDPVGGVDCQWTLIGGALDEHQDYGMGGSGDVPRAFADFKEALGEPS